MLAVIDASPVGGGPVSRALACAASEAGDAQIVRVRAFDLFGAVCATCMTCTRCGRCTKHHPTLDTVLATLSEADTLIVGTAGHLHANDPRARALVERLVGAFGHVEIARGVDRPRSTDRSRKRAAIICAAPALLGVPAALGMLPAGAAGVWRVLERSGASVVGCAAVGNRWTGPTSWDSASEPAKALGRRLAATPVARSTSGAAPVARRAAVLLSAIRP